MAKNAEKVAIVTGSTQGLGEAISRQLIAEKMIDGLVICGRHAENGRRLAGEFTGLGCRTEFVSADLARVEDCRKIVQTARDVFGRVD
jgi:NAD(P)-dependent dehydrogenase (short-subunit alcohol dehydrogenase family)